MFPIRAGDEAAVPDGDAMGVAGAIGEHGGGSGEGPFGIENPVDFTERLKAGGEGLGLDECAVLAKEL